MLKKWAANQSFKNTFLKQGQIKFKIVLSYLFVLKFYPINKQFSFTDFENLWIALIIKS